METTFRVEAKCNNKHGIEVAFKGFGDGASAMDCALTLSMAFPIVNVICEQTGEIMYDTHISPDWFTPRVEQGRAIMRAEMDSCF